MLITQNLKDELCGKKIIVTGGAGFIGSHLVSFLIQNGASVCIVDNLSSGRKENIHPKARFFKMNINDIGVESVFNDERPDFLVHLAFNTSVPSSINNPLIEEDSLFGSVRLFQLGSRFKLKKVVFASSEFIYGNLAKMPTPEDEALDPIAPYAISKHAAENYLMYFHRVHLLPAVVLRYATVYGPGQRLGAMTDYIRQLSSGKQADIWGDGLKTREYIYVSDVVEATTRSLFLDNAYSSPIFNVGTGVETTLNEVYQKIAKILDVKPEPRYHVDRPGEQMRCLLNSEKIFDALSWRAKVDLDTGLKVKIQEFLKAPC